MFWLQTHSYEACGEVSKGREASDDAEGERRSKWTLSAEYAIEETVSENLESLSVANGGFAVVLDSFKIMHGGGAGDEGFGEYVGGCDRVLKRDIDADAADGRHGVGCVSYAQQAGSAPLAETVDLNGEELDLVP